jgi:hypothetical protein
MRIHRTLYGPYDLTTGTTMAVFQTTEGDKELLFETFNDYYAFDQNLPMDVSFDTEGKAQVEQKVFVWQEYYS